MLLLPYQIMAPSLLHIIGKAPVTSHNLTGFISLQISVIELFSLIMYNLIYLTCNTFPYFINEPFNET